MIASVGVLGGGRMGAGIAQVFACAGSRVVVVEENEAAVESARQRIHTGLLRAQDHGALPGPLAQVESLVTVVAALDELDPAGGLVIEALPEVAALKQAMLARVERLVSPRCVLSSNTSSLSIDGLAGELTGRGRFLGMHFFNPVPVSGLVELITGAETEPGVVEQAVAWVRELGKQEIVVRDTPGFATSRLGVALGLEAIRMLQDGVSDAAGIDRAMELGYRHPMGPLRLTDLVGLDVRLQIAEYLAQELGPRFAPPVLLREKVAAGELGRKTGRGFYDWS